MRTLFALATALLLGSAATALAQSVDTTLWVTNGTVFSVVRDGGTIYIAGNFSRVGPAMGGGIAIDAATGAALTPYPKVAGHVSVVAPDGSGGWFIGGDFIAVAGQPRNNLAHLDASGQLTPWDPNVSSSGTTSLGGIVRALVVSGSTVYVGGDFTLVGGQVRVHVAAIDASTGAVTAWNPEVNGSGTVWSLAVNGTTVYVGGQFSFIGGQFRNGLAAIDASSGLATGWDPNPDSQNPPFISEPLVRALVVSGSTLYVGGSFSSIGGQPRGSIAALSTVTGAAGAWDPNANRSVAALALSGNTLYASGGFTGIGGQPRNGLAALDVSSGAATPWNPNPDGDVDALAVSGSTVYVGGRFQNIGGQPRNNIAALEAASGNATAWDPDADQPPSETIEGASIKTLAVSAGTVFAGGWVTMLGGAHRNYLAAIDAATGEATVWNPNANGGVDGLLATAGTLYVAGSFTSIGGQPRNRIAAFDLASGAATPWDPNANDFVRTLALSGNTLYVAGNFTSIGGQPRNRMAALDLASGAATAWDPNPNSSVITTLAASGNTIYAGGYFTSIGGQVRNYVAALDATTGAATAWDPNASHVDSFQGAPVSAVAVGVDRIFVGGAFTIIGATPTTRYYLAALDPVTGAALPWNPVPNGGVSGLTAAGDRVYVGGSFTNIGGQPRNRIAALVASGAIGGTATPWDPSLHSLVWDRNSSYVPLSVSGGQVFVAGSFFTAGGALQPRFAAISADQSLTGVDGGTSFPGGPLTVAPNPGRAGAQVQYSVTRAGRVRVELLDVSGRVVQTLADRFHEPGHYAVSGGSTPRTRLAPGLYLVRMTAPDQVTMRKLVMLE